MSGNINTLPNFIKAKSAIRLRFLMIDNNARLKMNYVDYTIVHDGKFFYAWYAEPIWDIKELKG